MTKYIWSNKYGTNPKEGIHKYLESKIPNYSRSRCSNYIKGFAEYLNTPNKQDSPKLAHENFQKFTLFIKEKYKHE